jgi:hypothetical protein
VTAGWAGGAAACFFLAAGVADTAVCAQAPASNAASETAVRNSLLVSFIEEKSSPY